MNSRQLAEKIYLTLKANRSVIGNGSIPIIQQVLDEGLCQIDNCNDEAATCDHSIEKLRFENHGVYCICGKVMSKKKC